MLRALILAANEVPPYNDHAEDHTCACRDHGCPHVTIREGDERPEEQGNQEPVRTEKKERRRDEKRRRRKDREREREREDDGRQGRHHRRGRSESPSSGSGSDSDASDRDGRGKGSGPVKLSSFFAQ